MSETPSQRPALLELGDSGLNQHSGYIREEWHRDLQGPKAWRVYKEMRDNDAVVGAILYAIEHLIRAASWRIEPRDESPTPQQREAADFCESCRLDMASTWQQVLSETLTMLPFGFALAEKTYKIRAGKNESTLFNSQHDDGRVGWKDIAGRPQETIERWLFDDDGRLSGAEQLAPPRYKRTTLPRSKLLHFTPRRHKGNPEGRSILRNAYRSWYFLKRLQEVEAIGIERNVAGLPVIHLPPSMLSAGASTTQRAEVSRYQDIARKLRMDQYAGLVFPAEEDREGKTGYAVRLMSSSGRSFADTDPIIRRYESRIAMSVLAEFLLIGTDKVGSRAMHEDKSDLFGTALISTCEDIAEVFNRDALPDLCELNGIAREDAPKLAFGDIKQADIHAMMSYVTQGVAAGALTPDPELEGFLREYGGLPAKENTARALAGAVSAPADASAQAAEQVLDTPEAQAAAEVKEVALNGAQVQSLVEIIGQVATRQIPRSSAIELVVGAFGLSTEQAERIIGEVGRSFFVDAAVQAP